MTNLRMQLGFIYTNYALNNSVKPLSVRPKVCVTGRKYQKP